mgnify:FL=1
MKENTAQDTKKLKTNTVADAMMLLLLLFPVYFISFEYIQTASPAENINAITTDDITYFP